MPEQIRCPRPGAGAVEFQQARNVVVAVREVSRRTPAFTASRLAVSCRRTRLPGGEVPRVHRNQVGAKVWRRSQQVTDPLGCHALRNDVLRHWAAGKQTAKIGGSNHDGVYTRTSANGMWARRPQGIPSQSLRTYRRHGTQSIHNCPAPISAGNSWANRCVSSCAPRSLLTR